MLYSMDYVYRVKAISLFEDGNPSFIFDFFVMEDLKYDEYFLFENIWRETLLLNKFYKEHLLSMQYAAQN